VKPGVDLYDALHQVLLSNGVLAAHYLLQHSRQNQLATQTHTSNITNVYAQLHTTAKFSLWWWYTVSKLVQETCTARLAKETWPSDMVSCTIFFLYKFLAPNTAQLYSTQETCIHVTRMVSSDWSAAYRCHCFHFVVLMLLTICCTRLI